MIDQPQIPYSPFQIEFTFDPLERGTILIIDDSKSNLEFLFKLLTNFGFIVIVANDGKSGIQEANYAMPDLILLDAIMPGIDGFDTYHQLKQNKATKNIPIIFMAALSERKEQIKALKMGAVDYMIKPIQEEELIAKIRTHLTLQNLQKQLIEQNLRLQQQMGRERLIFAMQERIRQSLNLEDILNTTVREVRHFLQTERVIIYRFKQNRSGAVAVESIAPEWIPLLEQTIADPCFVTRHTEFYREAETKGGKDIYSDNVHPCHIDLLSQFEVKSNLVVPIKQGEKIWGLLIANQCSTPRQWQQAEIDLIKQLVVQVGIAIQQAQLYQELKNANEKLHRLATLDSLTKLANRRRFNAYLNEEWRRLALAKAPLSLILCDIDFFKLYNDTYGHLAGDFCLQQVGEAIRIAVNRPGALVARYGGEELAVILPDTKLEDAFEIAEKIRTAVKELRIPHTRSPINRYITLSSGVASTIPCMESFPEQLIAAADQTLYRAKEQGRDRVLIG